MHPLARVCVAMECPVYFAVVEHGARGREVERCGERVTQRKGQGHHTYHSPGITRVVPPALSWCCARRLAGGGWRLGALGEQEGVARPLHSGGPCRNTVHSGAAPRAATNGGRTNENEVTQGEKKQSRQFGRSWRCTITEDITNSWMRARQ